MILIEVKVVHLEWVTILPCINGDQAHIVLRVFGQLHLHLKVRRGIRLKHSIVPITALGELRHIHCVAVSRSRGASVENRLKRWDA